MQLTGKCKEKFEKYLLDNDISCVKFSDGDHVILFDSFIPSMKYGVYEDFFDAVETIKEVRMLCKVSRGIDYYYLEYKGVMERYSTRDMARTAAIEKANQIFNER